MSFRELAARAVLENNVDFIKIPSNILNTNELEVQKYLYSFYKQNGCMPNDTTFLSAPEIKPLLINMTYFSDIDSRYDADTHKKVVLNNRISEFRELYAQQHFIERSINYDQFKDEMERLDKITSKIKSNIVTAGDMPDEFEFLRTGFFKTPLRDLNRIMSGGMGYGDVSLFAAGSGTGKSYFITFLLMYALVSGQRVVVNPSEMGRNGYWSRFISWASGTPYDTYLQRIRSGDPTVSNNAMENYKKVHHALKGEFGDRLIFTKDNYGGVNDFKRVVDEVYENFGEMSLFITDTIKDVETSKVNNKNTFNDNAAQTSKELRNWVTEYNEPSVGKFFHYASTAQYVKSVQNTPTPTKDMISGSVRNYEDATYVFGFYSQSDTARRGIPIKTRHGAGKGFFEYAIDWDNMSFTELLSGDVEGTVYNLNKDVFGLNLKWVKNE